MILPMNKATKLTLSGLVLAAAGGLYFADKLQDPKSNSPVSTQVASGEGKARNNSQKSEEALDYKIETPVEANAQNTLAKRFQDFPAEVLKFMYDVEVDSMSDETLLAFAYTIVTRDRKSQQFHPTTPETVIYSVLRDRKISDEEIEKLAKTGINRIWAKFEDEVKTQKEFFAHGDSFMLEDSLRELAYLQTHTATQYLIDFACRTADSTLSSGSFGLGCRIPRAVSAIKKAWLASSQTNNPDSEVYAVFCANGAKLQELRKKLEKLSTEGSPKNKTNLVYALDDLGLVLEGIDYYEKLRR